MRTENHAMRNILQQIALLFVHLELRDPLYVPGSLGHNSRLVSVIIL